MGAAPLGYLLALARPKEISDAWLGEFCAGLAADNAAFGIAPRRRYGVDTGAADTLSLTAIGEVPTGRRCCGAARNPATTLDLRTLGDAALGLKVLQGARRHGAGAQLPDRALPLPQPRLALGQALRGIASAAIDVLDGLVADLGHILETSGVGAELHASEPAAFGRGLRPPLWLRRRLRRRRLRAAVHGALEAAGRDHSSCAPARPPAHCIGMIRADQGLHVLDEKGENRRP